MVCVEGIVTIVMETGNERTFLFGGSVDNSLVG